MISLPKIGVRKFDVIWQIRSYTPFRSLTICLSKSVDLLVLSSMSRNTFHGFFGVGVECILRSCSWEVRLWAVSASFSGMAPDS